ncbi:MAG TPA: hypothetical protein VKZ55_12225 [Microthrixaceae bacterium]|nr:hypothetical protein [Microthrixaceae bacterium]
MTPPAETSGPAPAHAPALHLVPDLDDDDEVTGHDPDESPEGADAPATGDHGDHEVPAAASDAVGEGDGVDEQAEEPGAAEEEADERPSLEVARRTLEEADPVAAYKMVAALARPTHNSVLQALPYTPALPFHDPSCVVVDPEPVGIEAPELYARAAYPDFDKVLVEAFADPALDGTLTAVHHLLVHEGANVALVTNHGQIIDIALVIAALQSAVMKPDRSFGVLGERISQEEIAQRTNVLVSRMVTTRQAFNVPAIQILQSAARIFLSIPQTASRRRARIDTAIVRANNLVMRHELDQRLSEGGQLLAMAASGSQDLTVTRLVHNVRAMWRQRRGDDPGEAPTLHLQPLYDGTITLMRSCRYVLPVAICLDPATPACVVGGLTMVREPEDCHRIMDWIALAHQEATGVPTIYHWHEDDLLTQVRAFLNR